ncbi:MAG: uroporphyrinogen decarboxylase [Acidobacteriota bacterium]
MSRNDLFLRVCRGEAVSRPPVWMMRQAGRYLPQYRAIRAQTDFLTLCKTPELACEVTLQPVDLIGVDAAIIFADILLPLEAMGCELRFEKGEGPVFPRPVRDRAAIDQLSRPDVDATLGYVFEALRQTRHALDSRPPERRVPLIGFAGTPWTLASYLVEGGISKSFAHLLGWTWRDPDGLTALLDRIAEVTIAYLRGQIAAGAEALQIFDTWGPLLDEARWRRMVMPSLMRILDAVGGTVPRIFYAKGAAHLLDSLAELPVEVLSVDWRQPLDTVRRRLSRDVVLQGNLDPTVLLAPEAVIRAATTELLEQGRGGGHVVNLGHGILPMTPPEHARVFVDTVKEIGDRYVG